MLSEQSAEQARLAELLGGAAEVVMEFGIDGRILFASSAVERLLGRSADAVTGLSFLELVLDEDRDRVLSLFQKMLETGAEPLFRARFARLDGIRVDFETSLRLFQDESDERRIVGVLRDITERSAEGAAAESRNAHYRALVECGQGPGAVVSMSGEILFSNRRFKNTFGPVANLSDFRPRIQEAYRTAIHEEWTRSIRTAGPVTGEGDIEMQHPDGSTAWYGVRWEAFRTDQGERQFTFAYEDITQRKKVEIALRSIAGGVQSSSPDIHTELIGGVAEALGLDQLILGTLSPDEPNLLRVVAGWSSDGPLEFSELDVSGLPDEFVARGEVCVHPKGVSQILPAILSRIGQGFESYAGQPLHSVDGTVIGLLSGYSRTPLRDLDLTRALFSAYATHAAASMDRNRADASARANQDRFDTVAYHSNDMLAEVDERGVITYISEAVRTVLGYTPEEFIDQHFSEVIHPDDPTLESLAGPFIEGQRPTGPSSDTSFAEEPTSTNTPLTPNTPRSSNTPNTSEYPSHFARASAVASAEPGRSILVNRVRHANGEWRWIESRVSVFTAFDGSSRALFQSRDITDRRQSELGHEMLYRVVQQGQDLVFVCDQDSANLVFANQAAHQFLAPGDTRVTQGQPFVQLLTAADALRWEHEILPSLRDSEPWIGELCLLGPASTSPSSPGASSAASSASNDERQGSESASASIPTEATIFFCGNDDSGKRHLAINLRDVSDRRKAEEALRESELRLGQSQKMEAVGRLAGGIAHDFNNLLTAIMGYGDLVLDEIGENHVAHRDMEEILRAAERAGGLTRQLLAFSRRQVLQPESIDLNSVVADTDRMMRRLIGENIELVTVQAGELRPIIADPGQIEQVIVNLVVNARDAMPSGGQLEIETANISFDHSFRTDSGVLEAGQYVKLRIADTGIGMDKETRAQIFEPFFTTKEVHQGTGLGLATAYGIISQSGGQIDVESSPGRGSQFTLYLPAVKSEVQADEPQHVPTAEGGHETILLVEDADAVRHLVCRTLEKKGYTVLSAGSATAAFRHCSRHAGPIDLLLSDVVLPKTPGPEIARRAAEIRPGLPVLFMSGFTDETLSAHGIDPSEETVLEKPFTPAELLNQIRAKFEATASASSTSDTTNTTNTTDATDATNAETAGSAETSEPKA
ncbi:MAG: PAS domain S-box protein [Myxococcota bacterium]